VWLEGYQALLRWRKENEITGLYAVPYDTETAVGVTKDFPLGRWVHQQRKALRAGELEPRRKELLDAPEAGMVWEPGEEAWENKLAALRSFRRAMGHLAPRQDAVWGEGEAMVPVGQHMANLRRKDGLGKDAARARVTRGCVLFRGRRQAQGPGRRWGREGGSVGARWERSDGMPYAGWRRFATPGARTCGESGG
jgi:hypothetical protein